MITEFLSRGGRLSSIKVYDTKGKKTPYDPLILYGASSNGKSRLAKKLAQEAQQEGSNVRTEITTELIGDLVEELRDISTFDFELFIETRYDKSTGLVILEDFHEIRGRDSTQILMANLVRKLAQYKQVIIVCTGEISNLRSFCEHLIKNNCIIR